MATKDPAQILKYYWGFDSFRTPQEKIIQSVLNGRDSLALLPTGGGKSICFQVPAICMEGICIVISPLIALMKDQVYQLQKRKINAVAIYSGMYYKDIDRILDNCVYGDIKLLYLSPERLKSEMVIERIKKMKVNLIAVDEAHCVSQWGYDFRPSYLQIAEIRPLLSGVPVLALTATATSEVVADIQEKLEFRKSNVFQKSFVRQNLAYVVLNEESKQSKLLEILKKVKGSGIVYVRNRKKTKETAMFLQNKGITASFYHAGVSHLERSARQEGWLNNQIRIIVSTNAFGMGIDKPDVKIVVHLDLPESLEAYFQEAGRAGRDGKKAYAVLLYNVEDKQNLERNFTLSFPEIKEIKRAYQALSSYFQLAIGSGAGESFDFDLQEFAQNFEFNPYTAFSCLKILEQAGWIVMTESVYTPSSLRVIVNKEELYDYQLRNPKLEKLIKTILQSYQGVFNDFVAINEWQLARFLHLEIPELIRRLHLLEQDAIIDFRPQKDQPQIVFLVERVPTQDLVFDRRLYEFRKQRYLEKLNKAIAYAENTVCRNRQLITYFGEEGKDCGICDVCLGRNKVNITDQEYQRFRTKIKHLLTKETLTLEQLVQSFSSNRHHRLLKAIEYLVDEGFIETHDNLMVWKE